MPYFVLRTVPHFLCAIAQLSERIAKLYEILQITAI
jgi:hypothetical protein